MTSKNLNRREAEITGLEPKLQNPLNRMSTYKNAAENRYSVEDICHHMNGENDLEMKRKNLFFKLHFCLFFVTVLSFFFF